MSNDAINRMLEINKRIEKATPQQGNTAKRNHLATNKKDVDTIIEEYDNQVYGPAINETKESEAYNARKEMEYLKEIRTNGRRANINLEDRKIPKDIVDSILTNPLDMPINDSDMDLLEERIRGKMPGIEAAADILERVEKQSKPAKEKVTEETRHTSEIDYSLIKMIVEQAIDEKFKSTINESTQRIQSSVPSMKLLNFKDNFYFVDNDDNVFECVMKYKGKRKKRQK